MESRRIEIPDRFETLEQVANESAVRLEAIVERVDSGLQFIRDTFEDMTDAASGAFRVVRGPSGCGKTTLLRTLHFFMEDVETRIIYPGISISETLADLPGTTRPLRVLVIEGRERQTQVDEKELEDALLAINSFIRSPPGRQTLIVWPCTDRQLVHQILAVGKEIGGGALLGPDQEEFPYEGPPPDQYVRMAAKMIAQLYRSTTLDQLGIAPAQAEEIASRCSTLGDFLGKLRREVRRRNRQFQESLRDRLPFRLWIAVSDGNESGELVQGLVQGAHSRVDLAKLFAATQANVTRELEAQRATIGLLVSQYDVRLLHLPVMATVAIARNFACRLPDLNARLERESFKTNKQPRRQELERLVPSDLGRAFTGEPMGQQKPGPGLKEGGHSREAFAKLHRVVGDQKQSVAMNRVLGETLVALGLATRFRVEKPLAEGWKVFSDLYCEVSSAPAVRLEVTWRGEKTNRASIAAYVLEKLKNYGRALGALAE